MPQAALMPNASTTRPSTAGTEASSSGAWLIIKPGTANMPPSMRFALAMRCKASFCAAVSLRCTAVFNMNIQGCALPGSSRAHCSAVIMRHAPSALPYWPQMLKASA